ncbi:palmitoyltransferase PFA5 [Plenodomus tracheiphilus IPT5]|uniref:Palmitoyltransferase n=1 Tax=Plenodomus tracheiphilus IPT5 TaxID=1408161 RepID=A0A6A7ASV1_9PLEO|nr:palmitoyltransferase PFA5 [Plenodomus tracheiphilus IPT5]
MAPPAALPGSQTPHAPSPKMEQSIGQATSVIMPLLELGAIGFVTWVLVYQICVQYLISPSLDIQRDFDMQPRRATGIALIVLYAIVLLILLVPWMRLLIMIWSKPDLVPLGIAKGEKGAASTKALGFDGYVAFICDYQGDPLWCDKCSNWKPDRTHHCKELGRCVRRMDHYCPWAGGIIGESTHKWFMQFVSFAAVYTLFVWIVVAVFLSERNSKMGSRPGTWIGALVTAVLFFIFTFTMSGMTGWNLMINFTSVEAIQRGGIHNIAFLISHLPQGSSTSFHSSTPPTPPGKPHTLDSADDWPVLRTVQRSTGRTYVVMQTKPLEHPWYTSLRQGWDDTMGTSIVDWFLPFKQSPCLQKSRQGEFAWGEVVYEMADQYEKQNPGSKLALLEVRRGT